MKRDLKIRKSHSRMIEQLEGRQLFNGVVTAIVAPGGSTLTINGDGGDNSITVTGNVGGVITVAGSFTAVNGGASASFPGIHAINMNLGNGNDSASISGLTNANGFTTLSQIAVNDNSGGNVYQVFGTDANIGTLTINTAGNSFQNVLVGFGGAGNGVLNVGTMNITSKAANNSQNFISLQNISAGALNVNTSDALSQVVLSSFTTGAVNIKTGNGSDFVNVSSTVGTVGSVTVNTGGGNDQVGLSTLTLAALNVNTGDGFDVVSATGVSVSSSQNIIDGGGQNDLFQNGGTNGPLTLKNFEGFI